ncbi:MAG: Hsp20/alpha crystallin family protein [Anaerolineae bacterium]|nr:Hsp20/alpha crystallin family protein [Anaerolineae bacterium]
MNDMDQPILLSSPPRDESKRPRIIMRAQYKRVAGITHIWQPPTDVYETAESIIVRAEIAGMAEAEFTISLENRILMIYGRRTDSTGSRAYHQMEIRFGEFMSVVELAAPVIAEEISAEYQDGFLHVNIPKLTPSSIKVEG